MIRKNKKNPWTEEYPAHGTELPFPINNDNTDTLVRVVYVGDYLEKWGPLFQAAGDLCFDLRAAIKKKTMVFPSEMIVIPLGVKFDLPPNLGIKIIPRSSLCKKGLFLANHSGRIDPDYRGEVFAPVYNFTDSPVPIDPGERIVQGEITVLKRVSFQAIQEEELSKTLRGEKGYGSTGKK